MILLVFLFDNTYKFTYQINILFFKVIVNGLF